MTNPPIILIVDDQPAERVLMREIIQSFGYETQLAGDGVEALDMVSRIMPDLILLDIVMPKMGGEEFLRRIRQVPGGDDVPVVVVSGNNDMSRVSHWIELGAEDYFFKPIYAGLLKARIKGCIQQKRERRMLEAYNHDLEHMVARRTAQLEEKNIALEDTLRQLKNTQEQLIHQEKMASLGSLSAGIAHEIKNPLNFIINFAKISEEMYEELNELVNENASDWEKDVLDEVDDILSHLQSNAVKIREHGSRVDRIIYNMLLHARGKSNERKPTDINDLVSGYVELVCHGGRTEDRSFNIQITSHYQSRLPLVDLVPGEIGQVIVNILNNACYALIQKKKRLNGGFQPSLEVGSKIDQDRVVITIRDNGPGIPPEILANVFKPFFTTKPAGEGTGLGLSISYNIVHNEHGGDMRVESVEGEYTRFEIILPIQADIRTAQ